MLAQTSVGAPTLSPSRVDLRQWCSPVEDQGQLGSCTANAAVGVVEYFERRAFGKHIDGSRLFVYKVTRDMLGWTGDTGAYLRSTMGTLALFGVPPEKYMPYTIAKFEQEPSAFMFALAQSFQAQSYYRLDAPGLSSSQTARLDQVAPGLGPAEHVRLHGLLVAVQRRQRADPLPSGGRHRRRRPTPSSAVGYDDNLVVKHPNGSSTTGALLIRNSWSTGWGEAGYGWLPYKYVLNHLADDWWVLIKNEWVDTGAFSA